MALLVEPYYDDRFEEACSDWADDRSEEFYIAIKDSLHPDLTESIKIAAATSLAYNYYCNDDCKLCEAYGLTTANAVCYLNEVTGGKYNEEVDAEFKGYLSDRY